MLIFFSMSLSANNLLMFKIAIRSYKELMVQCNVLGRSESRMQQKLEKAKEILKKLKVSSASYINLWFNVHNSCE